MVELVDTLVLGTSEATHGGSSPSIRTRKNFMSYKETINSGLKRGYEVTLESAAVSYTHLTLPTILLV